MPHNNQPHPLEPLSAGPRGPETPGESGTPSPTGDGAPPPAPATPPVTPPGGASDVDGVRREAASYRVKLREAEKKIEDLTRQQMSAEERAAADAKAQAERVQKLEPRVRDLSVQLAVERRARALNIVDENAAYRLLDTSKLEIDPATLEPSTESLESELSKLIQARPWLVRSAEPQSPPTPPQVPPTNPPRQGTLTMEAIKLMSTEEINRRWSEISNFMSTQRK